MVATTEEINCSRTRTTHHQTARIIQWLGGERAVDVPAEFDRMPSIKEDYVDHQIASVKGECIELLRLKPLNKQTFDRGSLLRRSSIAHLNRSSSDAQTTADEAYCTLSSHRSGIQTQTNTNNNDLIRKGSSSGSSSLSTNAPICTSSPLLTISIDDIYATLDCAQTRFQMANDETMKNDIGRLREIAQQGSFQQSLHLLPIVTNSTECSMELFHEIMSTLDFNERDFQILMDDFVQLLERKLSDIELKMFDNNNTIRSSSPSLFDMLNDLKTCLTILRRTEMQSLLTVFDHVLKLRLFSAALPENETMMDKNEKKETSTNGETDEELLKLAQYGIDELKIVKIEKGFEPLGLTITRADSGSIHIARIVIGGMAANTQLFQIHDQILEINDEPVTGRPLQHICSLMANATGMIKFLLAPPAPSISRINSFQSSSFFVRALYAYDPQDDPLVPCKELGLAFQRGDILRIVARDENNNNETASTWWQAYRENSMETDTDPCLAGLIPSDNLQQKRAALFKAVSDDTQSISSSILKKKKTRSTICFTCVTKREQKPFQSVYNNASFIREHDDPEAPTIRTSTNHFSLTDTRKIGEDQPPPTVFTDDIKIDPSMSSFRFYEPVFRLDLSSQQMTRPIVLLGAPNVGRHELRRRLLQTEPHLFDVAIPHTTRARRIHEVPDIDYHFVSETDFLTKIARHAFVEFGQYDRDLYGTSLDDIRHVVYGKKKICILNLNSDALRTFEKTDLYPFIVCIAAPSIERLKRLELDRREHLNANDYREIIRQSRAIERRHSLLFDCKLINNDLERTYAELRDIIVRIQHDDQQWIRACYRRSS